MAKWDKDYLDLCKRILKEGKEVENRTGINTIKVPSHHFHFDLEDEFPILTTKQLFIRQAVLEMLWIYQVQSNDVRWLQDRNVHIWDEWEVDEDGIYRIYEAPSEKTPYNQNKEVPVLDPLSVSKDNHNGNLDYKKDEYGNILTAKSLSEENSLKMYPDRETVKKNIKTAKYYGKEYAHTIGTAYGYIVGKFNLIQNLINNLKTNPNDRRNVISLWQDDYVNTAVLPSCVWSSEWDVTDGKLNAWVHQRSCDVPLGLPFNVTQYAVLLNMLAKVTDLKPGTLDWSIKDAHIYINQIEGIKEQIKRGDELEDLKAPELWLNPEITDFFEFDNSKECKDVKLLNYKHHGKIRFPLAQ